ncbi:MAG: hypothetical protein SGCHY_001806 [Lobulomycetales sp.]
MQWSASIVAAYAASYLLAAPLGARFPGVSTLEGSKRIVTFIHAIISTIEKNLIYGAHPETLFWAFLELAYLATDTLMDIILAFKEGKRVSRLVILHHVFISGLLSFVLARDRTSPASANVVKGDFFVGLGLLQNASTPFLTLAYLFRKAHIELGERIATLCTVVVYFLCRISLWPYMLHVYSEREKGGGMIGAFFRIPAQCQIGWSLLLGTNVCLFLFANFAC